MTVFWNTDLVPFFNSFFIYIFFFCFISQKHDGQLQQFIYIEISFVFLISLSQTVKTKRNKTLTRKRHNFPTFFFYPRFQIILKKITPKKYMCWVIFFYSFVYGYSKNNFCSLILPDSTSEVLNSVVCWMKMVCKIWGGLKNVQYETCLSRGPGTQSELTLVPCTVRFVAMNRA